MYDHIKNQIVASRKALSIKWSLLVEEAIKTRLFPEIWYVTESWLGTVRNRKILVIGYGIGFIAEALAKSGWDVTTIDPSLSNLKSLQTRFSKANLSGQFQQGEFHALPFEKESFNGVIALNVLESSEHPVKVLKEMRRVLTPGGYGVITAVNQYSPWSMNSVLLRLQPGDRTLQPYMLSKTNIKKALHALEFHINSILSKGHYLPIPKIGLPFNLPIPGIYVALVTRPQKKDQRSPHPIQTNGKAK